MDGYIRMTRCGHYTTPEEQRLVRKGSGKRGRLWCERCGAWRNREPKPRPGKVTQQPLF